VHAQFAPAFATEARPVTMRWLDEGKDSKGDQKPDRYAVDVAVKVGSIYGSRQIVCENDGSAPHLNGAPFEEAKTLCGDVASFGKKMKMQAASLADALGR
jgi:hypothetical protein